MSSHAGRSNPTKNGTDRRSFLRAVGATPAAAAGLSAAEGAGGKAEQKTIRLGLIGCGGRGNYLARKVLELAEEGEAVEFTAACDIYQPRLERTATHLNAKEYKSASDLVRDPNVDAVIIATPDRVHVYNALGAVRAGKDVYCEKPLTHWAQFEKLKELVREVRKRKTVFQVGAQWVSDPMWRRAAEEIRSGAIGKPVHAQTGYFRHGDQGERGMKIDDPKARPGVGLDWEAFQADAPRRPFSVSRFFQWRMYLDYSGGPATDLYPHPMTRLFKALGVGLPKKVVAVGGRYVYNHERTVPDTFDILIEYPEGLNVAVLGTIANNTGIDTVIRGTKGTVTYTGDAGLAFTPQPDEEAPRRLIRTDRTVADHLADFLRCIRTRETPAGDIELGYRVQVPLIMAMLSQIEGRVAVFDADSEEIRLV